MSNQILDRVRGRLGALAHAAHASRWQLVRMFAASLVLCFATHSTTVAQTNSAPEFYVGVSDSILRIAPDWSVGLFAWCPPGAAWPGFGDVAFDSAGNLYVADGINYTIYEFPAAGGFSAFADYSSLRDQPVGLAFDVSGNLYVSLYNVDDGTGPILKYDSLGNSSVLTTLPRGAGRIAFDRSGNLFATNTDGDAYNVILKIDPSGVQSTFVDAGPYPNVPYAIAFDNAGNLYVTFLYGYLLKYDSSGQSTFIPAPVYGEPTGLAFDRAGNFYVNEGFYGMLRFDPAGNFSTSIPFHRGLWAGGIAVWPGAFANSPSIVETSIGAAVTVDAGTVGTTALSLVFPNVSTDGATTVTPIASESAGTLPSGYELAGSNLAFEITTTAAYSTPPGILIAFTVPSVDASTFSELRVLHNENGVLVDRTASDPPPDPTTQTIYANVPALSPFLLARLGLQAQVQEPINSDGSSVFSAKRGVVPVKFTLASGGATTCQLPPARIALIRTKGTALGSIDENTYLLASDNGSNFRVSGCQYVYNLATGLLGIGTYQVRIVIDGSVVGSATFGLN